jgi:predicted metal-dependent hydrolase
MVDSHEKYPQEVKQGLNALKNGAYYQAHEHFETAWRNTPEPSREFYRALIHISGGFFRLSQGRPKAAKKFFEHAMKWLGLFPETHLGFDIASLKDDLKKIGLKIDEGENNLEAIKKLLHPLDP